MKYETAAAFRQALEQRLLARAKVTNVSLVRLRKAAAFDRLLARLAVAAPGRWVLKGALALDLRIGERTRTTKDIDLLRSDDEKLATADLVAAQLVDLGDFFTFTTAGRERLRADAGGTIQFRIRSELSGRLFEEVLIDIGFLDPLGWQPERVRGSDLLPSRVSSRSTSRCFRLNNMWRKKSMRTLALMADTRVAASRTSSTWCAREAVHDPRCSAPPRRVARYVRGARAACPACTSPIHQGHGLCPTGSSPAMWVSIRTWPAGT
ncbi:MAG: hypothetical protein GEU90_13040 [Gemmatimonas sp.]|nr:hypothetical protein [Gemmatimonas sp.]